MEGRVIFLLILAVLYKMQHSYGMDSTYANHQKHVSKLQGLVKHPIPVPNNMLKIYETELDYGFKPISVIVLEGVITPKTDIMFRQLGMKKDKGIKIKFNSNLNSVLFGSKLKNHKPRGNKERHSIVTIQSRTKGLEICLDIRACRLAHYGDGSINKMEISNFALTNVSYFTETPNDPEIDQYEMKCSKSACDIAKMKKKGKSFVFTRKLPTYKKRAHINLEESYKNIALHMDIRQDQKAVVFNTRSKNRWNKREERQYSFYFVKGNTYTIAFNIQTYGVTVSVNGMFFHYYKHRMDPERVKKLWFSWDQENGNYSFIGKDELGLSKPIMSKSSNLQHKMTIAPIVNDFEFINDQPVGTFVDSDSLRKSTATKSKLRKIELPKPNKQILTYNTDLICGFPVGSKLKFRGLVRNNSSILLLPIGENFEIMFTFNLRLNRVEMYTRDARDEAQEKHTMRFKVEKQMEFSFTSLQDKIQVCADKQCAIFTLLSEVNHVEFSNVMLSDISYLAKTKAKLQPAHHKLNCSADSCDVSHLQKPGSIFSFLVKLPVNETWYRSNNTDNGTNHGVPRYEAFTIPHSCLSWDRIFVLGSCFQSLLACSLPSKHTTTTQHNRFKIGFRVSENLVPFHMSVGTADMKTVFEAIDPDWDFSKEVINSLPLSNEQTHLFKFYIQPYGTLTSVDGFYFHFFRHRLEPEAITDIQYEWDLVDASYHNDGCYHKPPKISEDHLSAELHEDN